MKYISWKIFFKLILSLGLIVIFDTVIIIALAPGWLSWVMIFVSVGVAVDLANKIVEGTHGLKHLIVWLVIFSALSLVCIFTLIITRLFDLGWLVAIVHLLYFSWIMSKEIFTSKIFLSRIFLALLMFFTLACVSTLIIARLFDPNLLSLLVLIFLMTTSWVMSKEIFKSDTGLSGLFFELLMFFVLAWLSTLIVERLFDPGLLRELAFILSLAIALFLSHNFRQFFPAIIAFTIVLPLSDKFDWHWALSVGSTIILIIFFTLLFYVCSTYWQFIKIPGLVRKAIKEGSLIEDSELDKDASQLEQNLKK